MAGFTSGSGTRKVESHLEDLQIDTVQKEVRVFADEIMVMYLGQCVEYAKTKDLFREPLHPYTQGLLNAVPIPKASGRDR